VIAREVVQPGGPAFEPLIERFGEGSGRRRDHRPTCPGEIAFGDPAALADLNAITHPASAKRMRELRDELTTTDHVVVYAIPLLRPAHREVLGLDAVVVVDCPTEVAVERLVNDRGMDRQDALARIAAQIGREERREGADYVSTTRFLSGTSTPPWPACGPGSRTRRATPGHERAGPLDGCDLAGRYHR